MADYTQVTDFSTKDGLTTGNALKKLRGSEFDVEFDAISIAIATKYDNADIASNAQADALTSDAVLVTPLKLKRSLEFGTFTLPTSVGYLRAISTGGGSLTGGGDLTTNRTLTLVNDNVTPGNNRYYGTDGTGTKGFFPVSTTGGSFIAKPADTSRASVTVPAVDPDLTVSLVAGTYEIELMLGYNTQVSAGGGLAVNLDMASGLIGNNQLTCVGTIHTTNFSSGFNLTSGGGSPQWAAGNGATMSRGGIFVKGYVVVTATDTLRVRWAQQGSSATATVVSAGSYLKTNKIA